MATGNCLYWPHTCLQWARDLDGHWELLILATHLSPMGQGLGWPLGTAYTGHTPVSNGPGTWMATGNCLYWPHTCLQWATDLDGHWELLILATHLSPMGHRLGWPLGTAY